MDLLTHPKSTAVSILVSDLSASGAGRWGGGVRPFLLSSALQAIGCNVKIVGFCFGQPVSLPADGNVPIVTIPGSPYPGFLRSAARLLKHLDGDLIYAYKLKPTSVGLALLAGRFSRRPVVLDIDDWEMSWHGGDRWHYRPGLKQFARDLLKREGALRQPDHPFYLRRAEGLTSHVDAITTHTRLMQQRFGGTYVPNGKDTNLFDPQRYNPCESKARHGLSGYRVLMFPGAPRPYKGVEDILMALDRLNEPDLRLAIVGGSPYDDYDDRLIRQWGRWIVKMPRFPAEQMPEIVAAADIVVVPQREDPAARAQFPLKLTDGMAMGKPVLATRVGDIPEIVGDAGYLVAPNAPDRLAEAISTIFDRPEEARDRGCKARERCVRLYSLEAMGKILLEVFESLRSRGKLSPR